GVSDSPITLYFEPSAKLSAPNWQASGAALQIAGRNWVTIDGGVNGIIEATDVGTAGAINPNTGLPYGSQYGAIGIYHEQVPVSHVTIQNLTIQNMYVRTPHSTVDCNAGNYGTSIY